MKAPAGHKISPAAFHDALNRIIDAVPIAREGWLGLAALSEQRRRQQTYESNGQNVVNGSNSPASDGI
jgi:hypothetical protein